MMMTTKRTMTLGREGMAGVIESMMILIWMDGGVLRGRDGTGYRTRGLSSRSWQHHWPMVRIMSWLCHVPWSSGIYIYPVRFCYFFSQVYTTWYIYIYIYMYHNDTATRSTTSLFQPGRSHDIKQIDANSSSSTPPHPICVNVSPIPKERRVMQCMVVCGVCSFIPRLLPSKPDAAAHAHDDDDDDDDKVLQTPVKSKSKSKSKSSQGNDVLLYCSIRFVSIATLAVRCCSSSCSMCACVRVCPK
jgi:hypothetical protein